MRGRGGRGDQCRTIYEHEYCPGTCPPGKKRCPFIKCACIPEATHESHFCPAESPFAGRRPTGLGRPTRDIARVPVPVAVVEDDIVVEDTIDLNPEIVVDAALPPTPPPPSSIRNFRDRYASLFSLFSNQEPAAIESAPA